MQYINLTPHAIRLMDDWEVHTEYPASGGVARIAETYTFESDSHGNPVVAYGHVTDMPDPDPEGQTGYIVSLPVALALRGTRDDIYVSYDQVRNEDGVVIGSRTLASVC